MQNQSAGLRWTPPAAARTVAPVAATTAIEILLRHLLVSDIRSADSPIAALAELRESAASETKALCELARHARRANPKAAAEALAVAEDLARIVGEIATDVGRGAGEPIGPGRVMNGRRAAPPA